MTPIIGLWLAINGLGIAFAAFDLWDAALDLRLLDALHITDARRHVAKSNVRGQAVRVAVLLSFIAAGVIAAADIQGDWVRWLLITSAALISGDSVADRLARRKVMSNVEKVDR